MALSIAHTDPETGAAYPVAYHRVNALSADTLNKRVIVHMAAYADAACRLAGKAPVSVSNEEGDYAAIVAATSADDAVARAYAWLKLQPAYLTALDV